LPGIVNKQKWFYSRKFIIFELIDNQDGFGL